MKALDSFTVERLEELGAGAMFFTGDEVAALARIALAAKRAEPVAWEVKGYLCHSKEKADSYIGEPVPLYEAPQLNSPEIPDGWIKCSDQMPENDERKPVAVYTGNYLGQGMFVASYDDNEFSDYWEGTEIKGVTHWMPLPAAPEKGNG
ncbi:DUF551 domain-containing protein [Yersinia enterocolitica]|nr:DUF551 domain-containing protein [Yersinia enterocolitica]EKN6173844.1 DUF551 domain-containing protein [Yersinia enterocolitica]HDL7191804.1 DUF551 domain-containing protein [Yersinia enterocolitica]